MKKGFSFRTLMVVIFSVSCVSQASFALEIKAFNLTESQGYFYDAGETALQRTDAQEAVDYLYGLGVRHLVLTPVSEMANAVSSVIVPKTPVGAARAQERDRYLRFMQYIHSKGMTVGIRPIILVRDGGPEAKDWHGNIRPEDPAAWFRSLKAYLDIYSNIAKLGKAEEMTIGAELYSMTVGIEDQWSKQPYGFPREWTLIIRDLKKKLGQSTRVMYDINYTDSTDHADGTGNSGGEMERWRYRLVDLKPKPNAPADASSKAWEQLRELWLEIDMVGVDIYRSLMGREEVIPEDYNDLVAKLQSRAEEFATDLDGKFFEIQQALGQSKRVVIKETGFKSCKNCFIDPFIYDDPRREVSIPHQAAGYQAIFNAFVAPNWSWLAGVAFWDVAVDPRRAGPEDPGFTPRGKAMTEDVIQKGWGI